MGIGHTLYKFSTTLLALAFFFGSVQNGFANEGGEGHEAHAEKKFNPAELIFHHVTDSHEWNFAHMKDGSAFSLYLPVIAYTPDQGIKVFSSSHLYHGTETFTHKGEDGHEVTVPMHEGMYLVHEHLHRADGGKVTDFSITKNVLQLFLTATLLLVVFISIAGAYKKRGLQKPSGMQSFLEPIIIFIRDDIARPNIGPKYAKFLPYLLTVFFFVWFGNMLGMIPGSANVTGNIAVTMVLAGLTFIITLVNGNKDYWKHIYNTPGVPMMLKVIPIIPLIEFAGIFTKPFSLMIRLFANITAGHIILLSLISLTFIFESVFVGIGASIFVVAISFLELFVALLQAYVFTLLTSMYFGGAVAEHEHHDEEHAHNGQFEHEYGQEDHGPKANVTLPAGL